MYIWPTIISYPHSPQILLGVHMTSPDSQMTAAVFRGKQSGAGRAGSLQLCVHWIKEQKTALPPQTFLSTRGRQTWHKKVPSKRKPCWSQSEFPVKHTRKLTHLGELPPEAKALDHGREDLLTKGSTQQGYLFLLLLKHSFLGKSLAAHLKADRVRWIPQESQQTWKHFIVLRRQHSLGAAGGADPQPSARLSPHFLCQLEGPAVRTTPSPPANLQAGCRVPPEPLWS